MNLHISYLTKDYEKQHIVRVGIDRTDLDNVEEVLSLIARLKSVINELKREGGQ